MGDILHALPAVTALRLAHPEWIIDWVVEPKWAALLSVRQSSSCATEARTPQQPVVDSLLPAAAKQWGKRPLSSQTLRELRTLRRTLRARNYDAAVDFQGAFRSAWFARFAHCRLIGEAKPREWAAHWLFTEHVATSGAHVIEQDFELAAAIAGDDLQRVPPLLPCDSQAEAWADSLAAGSSRQPLVLINPGAGWGAKRWPAERYAAVAQQLIAKGCKILVNAGPGEEPIAEVIVNATAGAATLLAPSLENLIAITRRIALLVAGDTGPLHLACALGKPVVGIYGPTDPSRNGPYGTRFKVLRHPASVRDHARRDAPEAGLLTIQPHDVVVAAEELLNAETNR